MSNFSRKRPASKGDIVQPTTRTSRDAVTGEVKVTPLDGVQRVFEMVRRFYEVQVRLWLATTPEHEKLADLVMLMAIHTKRHTDTDLDEARALLAKMNARGN